MIKSLLTTILDPEIKNKLFAYSKKNYIPKAIIVEKAIKEFGKKYGRAKTYNLKHADFDRVKTISFTCSVPNEIKDKLTALSEQLGIGRKIFLREIITEYVLSLK